MVNDRPDKPWATYVRDPRHGPLPALLLALTVAAGVVDAVSLLGLGRVFVANMTGNIIFIGLALAGVGGFVLAASVAALAGFILGAVCGGALRTRMGTHRGRLLRNSCAAEVVLIAIALAVLILVGDAPGVVAAVIVAALCAVALGIQNTIARELSVPDLPTTVLTMDLTGIASDFRRGRQLRRTFAILAMFAGAVVGALLVLHAGLAWALSLVVLVMAAVAVLAAAASTRPQPWHSPPAAAGPG